MYISQITISNFRNFKQSTIFLKDGLNVIIGHNNAGKTNLIKALSLILDQQSSKKLGVDDFNKNISLEELKEKAPKITITLTISESENEDVNSDDLATVGNFLTKLASPYEAKLTYEYFLPDRETQKYTDALKHGSELKEAQNIIKHDFIRLYTYKIYGGDPTLQTSADSESLQKFDFQFLEAIRDVERDMFTGRSSLLKDVIDFFMDYKIKKDKSKDDATKKSEIKTLQVQFSNAADQLIQNLQARMAEGKNEILSYAKETGASFNKAVPDFEGSISEVEMYSALRLIVQYETGISIPATHNGLGYNNLIFMSLLLAKMQISSDGNYLGSNAKVFPVLAIEEPEAHLHPSMQYKFLKFLRTNQGVKKKARQIFVSTHSTHITSAVSLDEIACLHFENDQLTIGYPGKVFSDDDQGKKSKAYVQRFLDATKSDMLFAQKIILVEGIAEQLLIPVLAKYIPAFLEDNHIAVINIGGRYFDHFLKLFDTKSERSIPKKIACLTDRDPTRRSNTNNKHKKCYPFEYLQNSNDYTYQNNASEKISSYQSHPNIRFFSQDETYGKTLEYDLALYNPSLELLLTDSISNKEELRSLMQKYTSENIDQFLNLLSTSDENTRIRDGISSCNWQEESDKKKAVIAARYLNSIGKGENALELSYSLEKNLEREDCQDIVRVPDYIKNAINWLCQ